MNHRTSHITQVYINLDRLTYNMGILQKQVGRRPIWPAIKANAYGHGAEIIGQHLIEIGYRTLCVAHISEAIDLVEKGLKACFIILSPNLPENSEFIVRYGFEPVVCSPEQLKGLSSAATKVNNQVSIHLKIDTGMGRVGVRPDEVNGFLEECKKLPQIFVKGIMSHFPRADEYDKSFSHYQIDLFKQVIKNTEKHKDVLYHFANSAAIFDLFEAHFDATRAGISIYGFKPSLTIINPEVNKLKPILSWKTKITYLKEVPEKVGLSYGHTFVTEKSMLIASIPLGYGDGISWLLSDKLEVLVHGVRCRQVGRICMDQCLIDVSELGKRVKLGDEVIIVGKQGDEEVTVDEIAAKLGTINHEIVTSISSRVPRIAVYHPQY